MTGCSFGASACRKPDELSSAAPTRIRLATDECPPAVAFLSTPIALSRSHTDAPIA
jgi:hypothetical protein